MAENVFGGLFAWFVEAIHVELSDEAVDVPVPEVPGEDDLLEILNIFYGKFFAIGQPLDDVCEFVTLK